MTYRGILFTLLLTACGSPKDQTNRLLSSGSPYLREHADNPVNWYTWGDEALNRAKKENKPVIVSIGYAACHWCHVMERETFMDPEVARIMNENFISIKVDREERPDIDHVYVQASEIFLGRSGWPLNAFTLPDGKPFVVATYAPKEDWIRLLDIISSSWKKDRKGLEKQATALAGNIDQVNKNLLSVDTSLLRYDARSFLNTVSLWMSQLDFDNGGLKGDEKFPMPTLIDFMLQHSKLTGDRQSGQWAIRTLDAMAKGGIYDHVGGGFSRYSAFFAWQGVHFEKMLYDNGQLVSAYSQAFRQTKNKNYKRIIDETLTFIEKEMTSPEGGFYSSVNADSEGEEGKFYKWSSDEFQLLFGDQAEAAIKYYGIEYPDDNVLQVSEPTDAPEKDRWRATLQLARTQRVRPSIDTKIITSWNAMMMIGFIDAHSVTGNQHYLEVALKNAAFIESKLIKEGDVLHNIFESTKGAAGFLDDYAWLAKAYIHLYQTTFDLTWLTKARKITDSALSKFKTPDHSLSVYSTDTGFQNRELFDNAIPSSNSVFAEALYLLGDYYENPVYTSTSVSALNDAIASIDVEGVHLSNWARLAEIINTGVYEIAIVGDKALAFSKELQSQPLPPSIFLGGNNENLPLLENKLVKNKTMIYVCKNRTCKLPVDNPADAMRQLK